MKSKPGFVHLHVHSDFSIGNSTASVTALVKQAKELGMQYLALTDHGNMFGIMEFIEVCKNNNIHPIIGCEVYVSTYPLPEKSDRQYENKCFHLILLATNLTGYFNLMKICSYAYTEGFCIKPCVNDKLLEQYHEGLIALSGCIYGEIPQLILEGKTEEAAKKARYCRELFGKNNFYLEIQDHGFPKEVLGNLSQTELNKAIVDISRRTGIPLVATNNVHYIKQEDAVAHDVLLCIKNGKKRSDENRKRFYGDQFYFKTGVEMADMFPENEYPNAITNTIKIAIRCIFNIPMVEIKELAQYLPDYKFPQGFSDAGEYLRRIAIDGIEKRYQKEKDDGGSKWEGIQKRLEYELDVIDITGFSNYFLIVADFVNWAREHNIPVGPGRGIGASSIVAYALQITNIDPIKFDLLFERFLNHERISFPYFDIDFGNNDRDKVIKYITKKYGKECVGHIIIFGVLSAKSAIRDVARVLSISSDETEHITNLIPSWPASTLEDILNNDPKLQEIEKDSQYTELFTFARKLEGLNYNFGIRAAGIVICKNELLNVVPLFIDKQGTIATQYKINHLEKCGLVKFDLLGLKTLDAIKCSEELIRNRGGEYEHFNIENIPENDPVTFELFCDGNTESVFQFESEGMRNVLRQAKPNKMEDLIALNALYRPSLLDYLPQFINSKNGKQKIVYLDRCLEDILKETYGVVVYQEQIIRIIQRVTGYSLGSADILCRILQKGDEEQTEKVKGEFTDMAISNSFQEDRASNLFDLLVKHASCSFCKSHSAAYMKLTYQTAFLKANFPEEYEVRHINY